MGEEDGDDLENFDDRATVDMRGRDDIRARRIDRDLGSIKLKIPYHGLVLKYYYSKPGRNSIKNGIFFLFNRNSFIKILSYFSLF